MKGSSTTYWESIGNPTYVASPMVDASELCFRQLIRRYGAQLCYTPMLHAKTFLSDPTYRRQRFDADRSEGPVVAQFAGDCCKTLTEAALLVQENVHAVDLNLGCPQPIARKGHYGSALLREADLIVNILQAWKQSLDVPFSCKIRLLDDGGLDVSQRGLQGTLRLVDQIQAAGVSALVVHGRNRLMTGKKTGSADWNAIAAIKHRTGLSLPIIANGNIQHFDDIAQCLAATGADAVMSAEALLENPALFCNFKNNQTDHTRPRPTKANEFLLAKEYLDIVALSPRLPLMDFNKCIKPHIVRILHAPTKKINEWLEKYPQLWKEVDANLLTKPIVSKFDDILKSNRESALGDVNMLLAVTRDVPLLQQAVELLELIYSSFLLLHSQHQRRDRSCVSSIPYNTASILTSPDELISNRSCQLINSISEGCDSIGSVSATVAVVEGNEGDDSHHNHQQQQQQQQQHQSYTWYYRHRHGSIESDRNKRKAVQQMWIETGAVRMTR